MSVGKSIIIRSRQSRDNFTPKLMNKQNLVATPVIIHRKHSTLHMEEPSSEAQISGKLTIITRCAWHLEQL